MHVNDLIWRFKFTNLFSSSEKNTSCIKYEIYLLFFALQFCEEIEITKQLMFYNLRNSHNLIVSYFLREIQISLQG